jgi:hypothetical protein
MEQDMPNCPPVVTDAITAITPEVIAGLDPAIHLLEKIALMKFDGYAGQARV